MENRPWGKGSRGWLFGRGPGTQRPRGWEALISESRIPKPLASPGTSRLLGFRDLAELWASSGPAAGSGRPLSPFSVQGHPGQFSPPVVLLRYFKILPPFYRGVKEYLKNIYIPIKKNKNPLFLFLEVWEPRFRWWKRQSCSLNPQRGPPGLSSQSFLSLAVLFSAVLLFRWVCVNRSRSKQTLRLLPLRLLSSLD